MSRPLSAYTRMPRRMPLSLGFDRYALYTDGEDDYVVIEPFTVYGWSEITIEELIYPAWPKANDLWSKFSMIGDYWTDYPSTFIGTDDKTNYTVLYALWYTRTASGEKRRYDYNLYAYRNTWLHVIRRFTRQREFSVWANGEKKYSVQIPADEKTVLEWNPDEATNPERYRRFVLGANVAFGEWMTMRYAMLRIYSRALTQREIRYNMLNYHNPVRDGLVLWLDFEEGHGDKAYDKSGQGNHGTIYGATWVRVRQYELRAEVGL